MLGNKIHTPSIKKNTPASKLSVAYIPAILYRVSLISRLQCWPLLKKSSYNIGTVISPLLVLLHSDIMLAHHFTDAFPLHTSEGAVFWNSSCKIFPRFKIWFLIPDILVHSACAPQHRSKNAKANRTRAVITVLRARKPESVLRQLDSLPHSGQPRIL